MWPRHLIRESDIGMENTRRKDGVRERERERRYSARGVGWCIDTMIGALNMEE